MGGETSPIRETQVMCAETFGREGGAQWHCTGPRADQADTSCSTSTILRARESRKTPGFTEQSLPGRYEPVGSGGSRQPQRNNVLASRRNLMSSRSLRRAQRASKHSCRRADGRLIRGQCLRRARAASARFCSRSTRRVEADPLNQNVFSVRKNPSALVGGKVNAKRCSKDELDFLYEGTRGLVQGELHFFREQFLLGRGLSVDPDESFGAMGPRRAL